MPLRLAVIVSHPIPHFAPWHREVARRSRIELKVFFSSDRGVTELADRGFGTSFRWDVPLTEGYEHEFPVDAEERRRHSFWDLDLPGLAAAFDRFDPHVIQSFGYRGRRFPRVVRWARRHRRPLMMYSDSHLGELDWIPAWKRLRRKTLLPFVYHWFDGAMAVGDNSRMFHRHFGLPDERIFGGCLPIERDRLLASVSDRAEARRRVRERHGIPEQAFLVLFCGKLIERKRVLDLVHALEGADERRRIWGLLVGEGPQRPAIEAALDQRGQRNVELSGFVNQSVIGEHLAAADALAVPSQLDPHPLVVTEAAAFGLPVVVSDAIGCIGESDTARLGENALVFSCGAVEELRQSLERLAGDPELCRKMSDASLRIADGQDAQAGAAQLELATQALHELGPRR